MTRTRPQTKSAYNKLSRWYDLIAGDFERKPRTAAIQKLAPGPGEMVLEIGCGTGQAIVKLKELIDGSGKIIGFDLSNGMLEVAQSRVNKSGIDAKVTLMCGDALHLPFRTDFFDKILICFTLELFDTPEIPQVLAECLRFIRKGGHISVVGLSRKQPNFMTRLYEWFHEKLPNYVDCRPIFVQEELENSGFQILQASDLSMLGLRSELVLAENLTNP